MILAVIYDPKSALFPKIEKKEKKYHISMEITYICVIRTLMKKKIK